MKRKDFEEKVQLLKSKSKWREVEKLCAENKDILNEDLLYTWVQSLIKIGRFIKAQDLLDFEVGEVKKKTTQYLKLRFDLMFSRRNYLEAVKVAQELIKIQPKDIDPGIRLAKSLMGMGKVDEADVIAQKIKRELGETPATVDLLNSIALERSSLLETKSRVKSISRKLIIEDVFDLAPPLGNGCSVVVPCYNIENFVERTIQSILDCGHADLEIILVDDCSTDGTLNILRKYQATHRGIVRVLQHKKNSGSSSARNTGLLAANMPYVTFIDSDDLMVKGGISRRINCLRTARVIDDRVIGSYGGSITINEEAISPPESRPAKGMKVVDYLTSDGLCPFNANQALFVTEFLRLSGGFPESKRTAEDWPFWLLLLRMGGKIVPTHSVDVTYRMRKGSLVRATAAAHLGNSFRILGSIENESGALYSKPYHLYRVQKNFIERYFNFWGMQVASVFDKNKSSTEVSKSLSEEFFEGIKSYIPDFYLINSDTKFIKSRILQGICRYYCVNSPEMLSDSKILGDIARGFAVGASSYAERSLQDRRRSAYRAMREHIDIVFLPHKEYHAKSAELIGRQLTKLGLSYRLVDFSSQYGDEGVSDYLLDSGLPALTINQLSLGLYSCSAVVVFNDWDLVARANLDLLKSLGAKTIGIVEGVNDYLSIDTGVWRPAYRYVESLLVPGEFHKKYFDSHKSLYVSGVQRLDPMVSKLAKSKLTSDRELTCVINCNFTYGVLVEHRLFFLKTICDVLLAIGIAPVISRHPQDVGDIGEYQKYVTTRSMYELLDNTKIFITRFSGAVYEALLAGAHVIYFNPGIERWDMFFDPMGAYEYATTPESLSAAVVKLSGKDYDFSASKDFLEKHCDIRDNHFSSSEKTAKAIKAILANGASEIDFIHNIKSEEFYFTLKKLREKIDNSEFSEALNLLGKIKQEKSAQTANQQFMFSVEEKRLRRSLAGRAESIDSGPNCVAQLDNSGGGYKNLFLIYSCKKYMGRIDVLRDFYRKNLRPGDGYLFIVGGAENSGLDGDILNLECGDTYEKLPEKVFVSICYAVNNFKFERLVKIDDDIFVNFDGFYKVITESFKKDYYGRKNPPKFGHPLNRKWHFGKVSKGHIYDNKEFPIIEPAQWCSGGCYILSGYAAQQISKFSDTDFVLNHVFEDYMIFDILSGAAIYPSFHEDSKWQGSVWMEPTLDSVLNKNFSDVLDGFNLERVVTIHCGPTNKYKIEDEDLRSIFEILNRCASKSIDLLLLGNA